MACIDTSDDHKICWLEKPNERLIRRCNSVTRQVARPTKNTAYAAIEMVRCHEIEVEITIDLERIETPADW